MEDYLATIKNVGLARWHQLDMPIKVYVEQTSGVTGFRPQYVEILKRAWGDWAEASTSKISIRFVSDPARARVICKWKDNKKDLNVPSTYKGAHSAFTLWSISRGEMRRANMNILTVNPHRTNPFVTDRAMRQVALHEVGHALGILGHSDQPSDIMFGFSFQDDTRSALSKRDINTLIALYTLDSSEISNHRFHASDAARVDASPLSKALRLNNEAFAAAQENNWDLAVAKLEEACKVDPCNKLVKKNLVTAYSCCGAKALLKAYNISAAAGCFKKAITLLGERKCS